MDCQLESDPSIRNIIKKLQESVIMSRGYDQSHDGGGRLRPLTQLVSGLLSAWTQGVEAFLKGAGPSTEGTNGPAGTAAADIEELQTSAKFSGTILPGGAEFSDAANAVQAALASALQLSPAIAQAYVVCTDSTIRYCGILADLFIRHEATLLMATADRVTGNNPTPVTECRAMADDLRALLREVGEAAVGEARRLESDLAKVGESVARAIDRATPSPHPHQNPRRHEVEP
jgi:hypothetical protein